MTPTATENLTFHYGGEHLVFEGVSANDLVLNVMRKQGGFYEQDILEMMASLLRSRPESSIAIDAGAFIGTHSIYLSKFTSVTRVLAFEASPTTYSVLIRNIDRNGASARIEGRNIALGKQPGWAKPICVNPRNAGMNTVSVLAAPASDSVVLSTIDSELADQRDVPVSLIKIDVEGMEIDVIRGALDTIGKNRPVLCIEIHHARRLLAVQWLLRHHRYRIVDCLGSGAPTYLFKPSESRSFLLWPHYVAWIAFAMVPSGFRIMKWYARRVAQRL